MNRTQLKAALIWAYHAKDDVDPDGVDLMTFFLSQINDVMSLINNGMVVTATAGNGHSADFATNYESKPDLWLEIWQKLVDLLEQLQDKYPARTDDFYYKALKACINDMYAKTFTTRHNSRFTSI